MSSFGGHRPGGHPRPRRRPLRSWGPNDQQVRQVAASTGAVRTTVHEYLARAEGAGTRSIVGGGTCEASRSPVPELQTQIFTGK
jgi:hypothetical protein